MTDLARADLTGLTAAEVAERIADGRVNEAPDAPVRTLSEIFRANVLTPVNAIMITLFVLILVAGFPQDGLFVGVVFSNAVIGIVQEVRAKRELDRLAVLNAPRASVLRDGEVSEIGVSGVVADDHLHLAPGDQVVVDGEIVATAGLQIDESLLTGEAYPVDKGVGDEVLSGSFVAAGSGYYRATRIGADSYSNRLAEEARRFTLVNSELRTGINLVLRWLTVLIPPASALLLWSLLDAEDRWQNALQGTVAAAVAMVPDGLVLLTSLAFVVGIVAIARRKALAKELATVELLARVDMLCLDKTGTITTGEISLGEVIPFGDNDDDHVQAALGAVGAADPSPNPTLQAITAHYEAPSDWTLVHAEPFSSARKWSASEFEGRGVYYLGAPEILFDADDHVEAERAEREAAAGRRVLLLTRCDGPFAGDELPLMRHPVAMVVLEDTVRSDAPEILAYFRDQGVTLKVISGDNAATVASVADRAGVPGAATGLDARELPSDQNAMADMLEAHAVFGRVTPHQTQAMVGALQSRGHVVAMTGDGVNDVLALKDSDMGIAMGSGSAATRAVAQLVLLDNSFATLPDVLAEGRKVINNIERVANLFVTKATYAMLLTAIIGIQQVSFPFLPRQLTLIGSFSIGLPGLILAMAPNVNLVRPGFIDRVLRFSIPAGIVAAVGTWIIYEVARRDSDVPLSEARTIATMTLLGIGLVILVVVSRPLAHWKIGLAAAMAALYVIVMVWPFPRDYFELDLPPAWLWLPCFGIIVAAGAIIVAIPKLVPGLQMERISDA